MAARDPTKFFDVAREFSDDTVTRDRGGSLGGITAGRTGPELLDVLAALKPGEVSRVIETAMGFQVVYRRPPPSPVEVTGRRIVIGYAGAPWLRYAKRAPEMPVRSRSEALALAGTIIARLQDGRESFERAVLEYSDHRDAEQGGDLGTWSNREATDLPREIEALAALQVGEVSEPLDSRWGLEILQRLPLEKRARYAVTAIKINYDESLPATAEWSKPRSLERARSMAAVLKRDPSRFAAFQREYCCTGVEQWTDGRGPLGAKAALDPLAFGETTGEPIDVLPQLVIFRRLDPEQNEKPPAAVFDLPQPDGPDLEYLVRRSPREGLVTYIRGLQQRGAQSLLLKGEPERRFASVHDALLVRLATIDDPDARVDALREAMTDLKDAIGSEAFASYLDLVTRSVASDVLRFPGALTGGPHDMQAQRP
jgi:hypothetical protein